MYPNATIQELQNLWNNGDDRKKLKRKRFTFESNVTGTKPYCVAKCHEFKSTLFLILISIKCIQIFFIGIVLLNIIIVAEVFFSQDMYHVLMVIPMLMDD